MSRVLELKRDANFVGFRVWLGLSACGAISI